MVETKKKSGKVLCDQHRREANAERVRRWKARQDGKNDDIPLVVDRKISIKQMCAMGSFIVVNDPMGEFDPGAAFSEVEFRMTLKLGFWANGMLVRRYDRKYEVQGNHLFELEEQGVDKIR